MIPISPVIFLTGSLYTLHSQFTFAVYVGMFFNDITGVFNIKVNLLSTEGGKEEGCFNDNFIPLWPWSQMSKSSETKC